MILFLFLPWKETQIFWRVFEIWF